MIKGLTRRFTKQFNTKHTVKHVLLTTGLTLVGGPWGLAMGITYCVGDTVDEMKRFKDSDFVDVLRSLPKGTLEQLIKDEE